MTKTVEEWNKLGVEWHEDGNATITLTFEVNVGGVKSKKVQMQCPSLEQMEFIDSDKIGTALAREKRSVAGLVGMAPEEMGQIKAPDYRRIQMVYADFLQGTPPPFIGAEYAPQSDS